MPIKGRSWPLSASVWRVHRVALELGQRQRRTEAIGDQPEQIGKNVV